MSAGFDYRDRGTPEAAWMGEKRLTRAPALQMPARGTHLLVLGAHPDDESLGAGGLIAAAARGGASVEVILATDGEASHPNSPTHTPNQLALRRRGEATEAIARLDPRATVSFLGLPDGGLRHCHIDLVQALTERLQPGCLVVTPWRGDRHPDHQACALAARALLGRRVDCSHWTVPDLGVALGGTGSRAASLERAAPSRAFRGSTLGEADRAGLLPQPARTAVRPAR